MCSSECMFYLLASVGGNRCQMSTHGVITFRGFFPVCFCSLVQYCNLGNMNSTSFPRDGHFCYAKLFLLLLQFVESHGEDWWIAGCLKLHFAFLSYHVNWETHIGCVVFLWFCAEKGKIMMFKFS